MDRQSGSRTQDTFTWKRMVWPYVLVTYPDGGMEIEVRDAICPRCRMRARVTSEGESVLVQCLRCNISEIYSPFASYDDLKAHVGSLILEQLGTSA